MFELVPGKLSLHDISTLLQTQKLIRLSPRAYSEIERSHQVVQAILDRNETVYGINTGFGILAQTKIEKSDLKDLQQRLILSHASGVGRYLDEDIVKLILLLKINSLAQGYSGISTKLVNQLIDLYNANIIPLVPEQGSVGASGDLAPLAHLSLALMGIGDVRYQGAIVPALDALAICHLQPYVLAEKEGLALINGTQVSTAIAISGLLKMQRNFSIASIAGALSLDATSGSIKPFKPFIATVKRNDGQILFSKIMTKLMQGSEILSAHDHCHRVQDPYSLRCQPQVMGAVWSYLSDCQKHLINEANGVSDNPLICPESGHIISGGNFHAEITAFSADILAIIGSEIGSISERRIALLIDTHLSGLPPFLVKNPGLNSGFMMAQVTASALASENKTYAHPASVDSLPTSANQEDHVSMATFAAVKLHRVADNVLTILAIETLAANQGIDFKAPLKTSPSLQPYVDAIRDQIPFYENDRYMGQDIEKARQIIADHHYYTTIEQDFFYDL